MSSFNARQNRKILINCAQNGCAHFQCVNNHYAKFEYKVMNTVGDTDYTNLTQPKHLGKKKCLSSTPIKSGKIFIKCAQNGRCTSSMCEQSLCKV